ncbi:MAG: 16S rRNA (cytosine(1402)-N(4))-methyltransferase RsmH [Oscillospiraceae bacterium]|nr:16S rRNA (cytosine(1402)-N(4))-methyltransferase RsmH [Oscillospiraceae bacterium]
MEFHHIPVLLEETVRALEIKPEGIYVDGTAGGGGHSLVIAKRLTTGKLFSLDRDPDAVATAADRLSATPRAEVIHANFTDMGEVLRRKNIGAVDGVLLDIGVSSHQLDTPGRGFSFHADSPLDMRMSQSGRTAAELVNTLSPDELAKILFLYGEEKFAHRIVNAIIRARERRAVETTGELAEIISNAVPAAYRRDGHPARKTFQALRIATNGELDNLQTGLEVAFDFLKPGGVLAVIDFHSLEDRIVKRFFAQKAKGCICPPDCPICICGRIPEGELTLKKPITPSSDELRDNPRSRSAKLRAIRRIDH